MFVKLIKVAKIALRLSTASVRVVGYSLRRWKPESRLRIANANVDFQMHSRVEIENCIENVDSQMQSCLEKVIFAVQGFAVAPAENSRRQSSWIKWSLA